MNKSAGGELALNSDNAIVAARRHPEGTVGLRLAVHRDLIADAGSLHGNRLWLCQSEVEKRGVSQFKRMRIDLFGDFATVLTNLGGKRLQRRFVKRPEQSEHPLDQLHDQEATMNSVQEISVQYTNE